MHRAVLIAAAGLSFNALAQTAPPAPDYLFNVAVFEVASDREIQVPYADFGKVVKLPGEIHVSSGRLRVDSTMVSRMDVGAFAGHLVRERNAVIVVNAAAKAGDTPRAPCSLGMNLELDFAGAALKAGDTSRIRVRTYEIGEGSENPEPGETLFARGKAAVEQGEAVFPTVEGETLVVEVVRRSADGVYQGCIAIITP